MDQLEKVLNWLKLPARFITPLVAIVAMGIIVVPVVWVLSRWTDSLSKAAALADDVTTLSSQIEQLQAQVRVLTQSCRNLIPPGSIIAYSRDSIAPNSLWNPCDGKNGRPDLNEVFLQGTSNSEFLRRIGGSNRLGAYEGFEPPARVTSGVTVGAHTHNAGDGRPRYYNVTYLIRADVD